ncbi:uncharacterized protein ACHE_21272A [Aspergillus chevalieri]|uniref:F-box domain protein n=1 Tax=Aspergillus chevalieri TaxID=182096 RepID=A0A7R7VJJ2_ASPCH|nr:uncharacterized protein ACHE_21272A [Aspergillus chevalieri]BCR85814.1 hypothetical protein ACHE_21272A [Aspergillus chevalieri]
MCAFRLTCKTLLEKTYSIFWRTSLNSIETDVSLDSLGKLQTISTDPQLRHCIHHLTTKGFDKTETILGEGFQWDRHASGHLVNLHNHPAVKQLCNIFCQLINCTSIEIYSPITEIVVHPLKAFEPTDAIPTMLEVISQTGHPVTSLTLNFMGWGQSGPNNPDPRCLQIAHEAQLIALGAHLENLTLKYTFEHDIVHDWTVNLLHHTRNLCTLHIESCNDLKGVPFFRCLALSSDMVWPQLQELSLDMIRATGEDLTTVLRKSQQSLRVLSLHCSRIISSKEGLKRIFQVLGTDFPMLQAIHIGLLWSGLAMRDYVHFPGVLQNPVVDELQGSRFDFMAHRYKGGDRVSTVNYSGPKMDVALGILAEAVDLIIKQPLEEWIRDNRAHQNQESVP